MTDPIYSQGDDDCEGEYVPSDSLANFLADAEKTCTVAKSFVLHNSAASIKTSSSKMSDSSSLLDGDGGHGRNGSLSELDTELLYDDVDGVDGGGDNGDEDDGDDGSAVPDAEGSPSDVVRRRERSGSTSFGSPGSTDSNRDDGSPAPPPQSGDCAAAAAKHSSPPPRGIGGVWASLRLPGSGPSRRGSSDGDDRNRDGKIELNEDDMASLGPLDMALLDDLDSDNGGDDNDSNDCVVGSRKNGAIHPSAAGGEHKPPPQLQDLSAQSRRLALGVRAGQEAAAMDSSSHNGVAPLPYGRQFSHPLHGDDDDDVDPTKEGRVDCSPLLSLRSTRSRASKQSETWRGRGNDRFDDGASLASSSITTQSVASRSPRIPLGQRGAVGSLLRIASKRSNLKLKVSDESVYHDEDEQDFLLEEEIFAEEDEENRLLLQEAHGLMKFMNQSIVSLGVGAPFVPVCEVFPLIKDLHANLKLQLSSQNASGLKEEVKPGLDQKEKDDRTQGIESSEQVVSNKGRMSNDGEHSAPDSTQARRDDGRLPELPAPAEPVVPPLEDWKAVAEYLARQLAAAQVAEDGRAATNASSQPLRGAVSATSDRSVRTVSSQHRTSSEGFHHFTAFVPNFLWYQPIPGDSSSLMRPTSLCSGTGVSSGLKYIDPEMLSVVKLYGSYFVGALTAYDVDVEDEKEEEESPSRSTGRLATVDESDDSIASDEMHSRGDGAGDNLKTELSSDAQALPMTAAQPVFSDLQMNVLQSAIEELLKRQNLPNSGLQS